MASASSQPVGPLTQADFPRRQRQQSHRSTSKLRTARRLSKYGNSSNQPTETAEGRKACAKHNQVEQQYRKRLNAQFERLLAVLPPEDGDATAGRGGEAGTATGRGGVHDGERRVSKAVVLDRAWRRIKELEGEWISLERQRSELVGNADGLKEELERAFNARGR